MQKAILVLMLTLAVSLWTSCKSTPQDAEENETETVQNNNADNSAMDD